VKGQIPLIEPYSRPYQFPVSPLLRMSLSAVPQTTVEKPASLTGTSLHTGGKVVLTLKPAPVDFGRKFKRVDLPDEPVIDAVVDHVQTVERSTTIAQGSVKVHTVEHVLSALAGMGVDNVLIEMDANEPPIGDGSAQPYLELIKQAGIVQQENSVSSQFQIREPVHIETKGGSILTVVPDSKFRISCTNVGPDGRFTQFCSLEVTPETYEKEIAAARTFVFYEDVKPLMDKGLIKGGSLENAVVIRGESVLSKEPLRFKDEFVRHKILDIIGDLSLFGSRIKGHVIAVKPGHGPNTELAMALRKEWASVRAMVPLSITPKGGDILEIEEIMKLLPHRYPFVMVDRIVGFEGDGKCTGVKCVSINEPFFQGHFPGHPVMPGVLQLEAMAQVGSIELMRHAGIKGQVGYFLSADKVKWRKPVVPGDTLFIHVQVSVNKRNIAKAKGYCVVNDVVVSEAELMFALANV
jgi:UDP-3-O-[3-hydroxymyristoyl] N-acetylglucosamine deacetylase/3-hydroxyacyl-[acyl-carrier-protein] dehydratase